jgi:alpha-L-rhamnosidase
MEIYDLRTEGEREPLGIDSPEPAFSWKLRGENGTFQHDYRICVASREELLLAGSPDMWDSGKINSARTLCVRYGGKPLADRTEYFWRAECNGIKSAVSKFETAYLGVAMKSAGWIGMPLAYHGCTDVVRLDFMAEQKPVRARLYLAALGCYRLYLNGKEISNSFFDGAISVYSRRVFYRAYALDIAEGDNALCVELGYGFYGAKKCKAELWLTYADGREEMYPTVAGRVWNVTRGRVTGNSIYGGEIFDGRISQNIFSEKVKPDTARFVSAYYVDAPAGKLVSCPVPPMKITYSFSPASVKKLAGGTVAVDAGKNVCGRLKISVKGERGSKACVRYAEVLDSEGRISRANLRTAENRDLYILSGEGEETYAPCFTYHGFRYAEIECEGGAEITAVSVEHMRTALDKCGEFGSCDKTLEKLHDMAFLTESNNLNGVFTDCPQRDERLGWLNDMASRIYEAICNFDLSKFLPNFVDMITESQDESGAFGDTVPFSVGSAVADGIDAYPVLGWLAYEFYGDERVLERNYEGFCRWNDRLAEFERDGIMEWGIYGDWCPAFEFSAGGDGTHSAQVSEKFMAGASYIWNISLTAQIAEAIGKTADAEKWRNKRAALKKAFFGKYLNRESGALGNGSQTECAIAITVFPEEKELCKKWAERAAQDLISRGYHTTCGNLGYRHLFYRLAEAGYADTLYKTLVNPEYPGWGYMLEKGATTVWERWEANVGTDMHSFNHPMFAAYDGFLYNYVAGIRTEECSGAFSEIAIEPCFACGVSSASASLDTVRGKISSAWKREGNRVSLHIGTPANTKCTVRAHGKTLRCGELCSQDELRLDNGEFNIIIE